MNISLLAYVASSPADKKKKRGTEPIVRVAMVSQWYE